VILLANATRFNRAEGRGLWGKGRSSFLHPRTTLSYLCGKTRLSVSVMQVDRKALGIVKEALAWGHANQFDRRESGDQLQMSICKDFISP